MNPSLSQGILRTAKSKTEKETPSPLVRSSRLLEDKTFLRLNSGGFGWVCWVVGFVAFVGFVAQDVRFWAVLTWFLGWTLVFGTSEKCGLCG